MKRNYHTLLYICKIVIFFTLLMPYCLLFAQLPPATSIDIRQGIKKLNVLGSALYIAAHPDDENTSVLGYLAQGRQVRTAYLALTRGDGGQNLLGPEQGALLGVLRTQELLSARRVDGAEQFFTRAIDFGYSKTSDETLRNWDREKILSDIVRVIRRFRPDIILTRFSETQGGHGHHLVSAILAKEAFYAAGDPTRFPEQLQQYQPWQAKRLLWNTWSPGPDALSIDIGTYNPILGESYQEFAAAGRSMHKSQGFGVSPGRGSQPVFFDLLAGDSAKTDLFDGIDLSWGRIPNAGGTGRKIEKLINEFNPENPQNLVPDLIKLYQDLSGLPENPWITKKITEVKDLIRMCSGLWLESIVWQEGVPPGGNIEVRSQVIDRSNISVIVEKIHTTYAPVDSILNTTLVFNQPLSIRQIITIPADAPYTQPFWLREPNDGFMFEFRPGDVIENPESMPALVTRFALRVAGQALNFEIPVRFRRNDAVKGEQFQPFIIRPALGVAIEEPTYLFPGKSPRPVRVSLTATAGNQTGLLYLNTPEGWLTKPDSIFFDLQSAGDQQNYVFEIFPGPQAVSGPAFARAKTDKNKFDQQIIEVAYNHIPVQTILMPASTQFVKLDIKIIPGKIGYIMGSGDEIPKVLTQLGYEVVLLSDDDLDNTDLSVFTAIICGIRAFNTRKELDRQQKRLIDYVLNGGTWIVQHNTRFGSQVKQIGPYPFSTSGRDRISEEKAPLERLIPDHPVFNYPNLIADQDFNNWVQERGLYFADSWEGKLYPLLSGQDENEPAKLGGLLYARYGKGVFIFTAYSWFRQLPAGVPGAARLFVNLISAGKED